MITVRQLLEKKGNDVWHIEPDASVFDAIKTMADKSVGALLVIDGGDLVGILSERDYARKVILQGRSSRETAVRDIMTKDVLYVTPDRSVEQCMAIMTEKRIRHLPVLENDKLVGICSSGDIIKAMVSEKEHIIEQLESYIKGR